MLSLRNEGGEGLLIYIIIKIQDFRSMLSNQINTGPIFPFPLFYQFFLVKLTFVFKIIAHFAYFYN